MFSDLPFTLSAISDSYDAGASPADIVDEVYRRIESTGDPAIFIHLRPREDVLAEADQLGPRGEKTPLWGIPFVVKDNIDAEGMPTTAACPAFAYDAEADACVVERLKDAGALLVGKTNLDQFATGLVGVRSPFGVPRNAVDPEIVPGGSSSGSAVAVAGGIVAFSLGTDTAGSGRVPAALNNIVGLKPSLGTLSSRGVVPACRTLDTVSVFALTVSDAHAVYAAAAGFDPGDPFSRKIAIQDIAAPPAAFRLGVPDDASIEFFGDDAQRTMFESALAHLADAGAEVVPLDFTPFYDVAEMLYHGAWVAERYTVIEHLMKSDPAAVHPVTRAIVGAAESLSAADAFRGLYRLRELARAAEAAMDGLDALCVPTIPTFYTCADLEADPVTPNSNLGTYTNFVNLLDMCGIAVPTAQRIDGRPGSVTFLARAGQDGDCAALARLFETGVNRNLGATGHALVSNQPRAAARPRPVSDEMELVVCGAHMSGMALNHELTSRGARLLERTATAACYRLFALAGGPPARPGLLRSQDGGAIEVEKWSVPVSVFGDFMRGVPAPLTIGTVELEDGGSAHGFLVEACSVEGARDITHLGSWRHFRTDGLLAGE